MIFTSRNYILPQGLWKSKKKIPFPAYSSAGGVQRGSFVQVALPDLVLPAVFAG